MFEHVRVYSPVTTGENTYVFRRFMENKFINCGDYYIGLTTKGHKFYFDSSKYDIVKQHYWKLSSGSTCLIAADVNNWINLKTLLFGKDSVNYIDGNPLNLREAN